MTALGASISGTAPREVVSFRASDPRMQARFEAALEELRVCIRPTIPGPPILNEGGVYNGCWLESTGTINAETLSRFDPQTAGATLSAFYDHQRGDGLLPYKLTPDGPVFAQIQLVTPPARTLWRHVGLTGDEALLRKGFDALARYDAWLARVRDTRGTGGVEAFCTFDTGHDASPRFWQVPDGPLGNAPEGLRADHPTLPFVAPDLTAAVACGRRYLARMAGALGEDAALWEERAALSEAALFGQCWDEADGCFYDRDRTGAFVRVQSDVLLRVLACEIGDDTFFDAALSRYLLSSRKFFSRVPFTSIAMDDPRFDPRHDRNSWAGPVNALSLLRAPDAFEAHGRHVELSWVMQAALTALFRADRFPQCFDPFTGDAGYTEQYSPAILCLLDYVERLCGIHPRPDGRIWFSGLLPAPLGHRDEEIRTSHTRLLGGQEVTLENDGQTCRVIRGGAPTMRFPHGIRVETDPEGHVLALTGLSVAPVEGGLWQPDGERPVTLGPNERLELEEGGWRQVRPPGVVTPTT